MKRRVLAFVLLVSAALLLFLWTTLPDRGSSPIAPAGMPQMVVPTAGAGATAGLPIGEPAVTEVSARREMAARSSTRPTQPIAKRDPPDELLGRVIDDLGLPVAACRIEARPAREAAGMAAVLGRDGPVYFQWDRPDLDVEPRSTSSTTSDGGFVLSGLTPGQWELTAWGEGDTRAAPSTVEIPPAGEQATLVVPRGATLSGIVVGSFGQSIDAASVHIRYAGERDSFRSVPEPKATTFSDGRFRIDGVLAGTVRVWASRDGLADSDPARIEIAPGETRDVRIVLDEGGRVIGRVDPSLGDVADREVYLYSYRGSIGWRDTKTDSKGRFSIEGVIPQDYVIELKPAGYPSSTETSGPGSVMIRKRIRVENGVTAEILFGEDARTILVQGSVTAEDRPVPGLEISATPRDGNEDLGNRCTTDALGRFELTVGGPGEYAFTIEWNQGSYVSHGRSVPDQDSVELAFEVPVGSISGRVLDSGCRPLHGLPITVVRQGSTDPKSFFRDHYRVARTGADGSFEFRLLAPGTYTLRVPDGNQLDSPPPRTPFGRAVIPDIEIDAAVTSRSLEILLEAEGRIAGVVVDRNGTPVTDGWVRVFDLQQRCLSGWFEMRTDGTGHFEILSVAPGSYTVHIQAGEREARSERISVEAGETATVHIEL